MHFFIEQTKIDLQPSAYGPVPAAENTQYRITSTFNLTTNAKAFACQGGSLLVLPSTDPLLVNVILKPDSGLQVPFPAVRYYIYRGLLKDSFITGSNITPKAATNSDLVAAIWRQVEKYRVIKPALPDPSPAVIGYLPALDEALHVETVFNNDPSLNLAEPVTLNKVNEGSWIGNFGTTAGLEIVTENDLKSITLGYLKKTDHVLSIAGIPNTTPADKLTLRMEKEKILHYIDPAAFWGMHYSVGMHVYDVSFPSNKRKVSLDEIYFEVMNKYLTKNRVYLDIRSEKGYSYNFYTNYGDRNTHKNLRFKIPDDTGFRELEFGARWPILMYHFGRFESPNTSRFIIQLRVDDNEKPLLFFENPDLINSAPIASFIKPEKLLNGTATDWTTEISLRFQNVEDPNITNQPLIPVEPNEPGQPSAGTRVYIGNHLRIQYFRLSLNDSIHPMVFNSVTEPERAFGGIDLLPVNTGTPFLYATNNKRSSAYHIGYSYVAETGIFYNPQMAMLYAKSLYTYQFSNVVLPAIRIVTPEKPLINSPLFPKDIVFEKWRVKNIPAAQEMDTIKIAGSDERFLSHFKEDHFFLGLSRTELETLRTTPGFHTAHTRYLVFESTTVPIQDSTNIAYRAFSVKVKGYATDGASVVTKAPATPVIVYELDNQLYFSKAFAQQSPIPYTLPDPGTMMDFSNAREQGEFGAGFITIRDKTFNDANQLVAVTPSLQLRRNMFWPDPAGNGILPAGTTFPLVMVVHGNGHYQNNYKDFASHLARNGFIVAVVDCLEKEAFKVILKQGQRHYFQIGSVTVYFDEASSNVFKKVDNSKVMDHVILQGDKVLLNFNHGMGGLGREYVIARHLGALQTSNLAPHIQFNNIGLIGHSRGGEAVVKIAGETIPDPANSGNQIPLLPVGCTIRSIISLAPTDQYDQADLVQQIPYFVLYGSRDGDVSGAHLDSARNSGFSLYDRAFNESEKTMAFIYGATHNGFITGNTIKELGDLGYPNGEYDKKVILEDAPQQHIANAYMNAFLRMTLKGEAFWQPLFTGEQKPRTLQPANHKGIFLQYQAALNQRKSIDDFDTASAPTNDWRTSTIGGKVEGILDDVHEESLSSPHQTRGLKIKWKSDNKLVFQIPDAHKNITAYKYISFRIARGIDSKQSLDDLRVELHDASQKIVFAKTNNIFLYPDFVIPAADRRENEDLSKEALMTVRIPLGLFPDTSIDRLDIKALAFVFPKGSGEVALDNVEFTN